MLPMTKLFAVIIGLYTIPAFVIMGFASEAARGKGIGFFTLLAIWSPHILWFISWRLQAAGFVSKPVVFLPVLPALGWGLVFVGLFVGLILNTLGINPFPNANSKVVKELVPRVPVGTFTVDPGFYSLRKVESMGSKEAYLAVLNEPYSKIKDIFGGQTGQKLSGRSGVTLMALAFDETGAKVHRSPFLNRFTILESSFSNRGVFESKYRGSAISPEIKLLSNHVNAEGKSDRAEQMLEITFTLSAIEPPQITIVAAMWFDSASKNDVAYEGSEIGKTYPIEQMDLPLREIKNFFKTRH